MKLLFGAVNCLIDPSSGAAISVRTLLRLLGEAGVECRSLTGSVYDQPFSHVNSDNLRQSGAVPTDAGAPLSALWRLDDGPVTHLIVPLPRAARALQTPEDEKRMLEIAAAEFDRFRPDAVMLYGNGIYERGLVRMARERDIATIFYLANPSYKHLETFRDIDQVFNDTAATRELYAQKLGLDGYAIGKFVAKPMVPAGADRPEFITFVNPSGEKGVTLFYRIAELARQVAPELRFLVVESRATLATAEQRSGMKFSALGNIHRVGLQRDMGQVFGKTRILLMPSVWHESGARAAIEACSLGIPTVATNRGGIPEVLADAGIMIPPPPPLVDRHWLIPPLSEAIPWVEALRQLTEDKIFYAEHSARAQRQWAAHDPSRRVADIVAILEGLVAAKTRAAS